jgi:hypothetical protein
MTLVYHKVDFEYLGYLAHNPDIDQEFSANFVLGDKALV